MKRFAFSLERVLEYRKQLELDRQLAFAKAADVFRRREDELRRLADELGSYRTRLAQMGTGRLSTRDLALYRSYLTHLEFQVARAIEWLSDASRELERRREALAAATKDRQVLGKLKEVQRADYDYQAGRQETKDLDEIGAALVQSERAASASEGRE